MAEAASAEHPSADVLTCGDVETGALADLLRRFGLKLCWVEDGAPIPGSYWGEPEAGLLGLEVYARRDTPVHSLLHEAGHTICADEQRRSSLHTEAGGDDAEENGVCYLQILLAEHLPNVGSERLMEDMDRWGYSFRLGSTRAWFDEDAEDARAWLIEQSLIDDREKVLWKVRTR